MGSGSSKRQARAAEEQARIARESADRQAAATREQAFATQRQQEQLIARSRVQDAIQASQSKPIEKAEVDVSTNTSTINDEEATGERKRRQVRQQFSARSTGTKTSITI